MGDMEYGLTVTSGPASEPVSLTLAKAHLRIDHSAEDDLITSWITAARRLTETHTRQRWITQTLAMTLEGFPCGSEPIRLPVSPVASISSIAYTDADGAAATMDAADYQTWLAHNPPLIVPDAYDPWPITEAGKLQAVTITFVAGTASGSVPEEVKTAILLTLGDWDKNRAGEGDPIGRGLPPAAKYILDSLWTGGYS